MKYNPKIHKKWSKELAYLCGLIIGDGSMPICKSKRPNHKFQQRYQIYFYCESRKFLLSVYIPLFKKLFGIEPYITEKRFGKFSNIHNCRIESLDIYNFLKELGVKTGKKAKIANVPKMPKKYEVYFLAGLLDTDGGKKGSGFGLSTASKELAKFCENIFKNFNIPYHSCPWKYRDHYYHQVYVNKKYTMRLLEEVPFRNVEKINAIKLLMPR